MIRRLQGTGAASDSRQTSDCQPKCMQVHASQSENQMTIVFRDEKQRIDFSSDRVFLAFLDAQLADAVTFLPPAMRASFHAQVGALIRLAGKVAESDREELSGGGRSHIASDLSDWRTERERIRQRTGG